MKKLPIKDVKEWVIFCCHLAVASKKSLEDGEVSFLDIVNFKDAFLALPEAIDGTTNVWPQLQDLDQTELKEIKDAITNQLSDVVGIDQIWWQIADEAIKAAIPLVNIFKLLKNRDLS